ncbi:transcriptional regulator [Streptomyces violaceoruber]|uniref:Transcriptional regulator n=2 Tax=Streptomyces TaxID=1883 RepID=A0A1V0UCS0_STRVN|nr:MULTISPECIES: helix-turn-helix transcriptional regulator [Streptomyces]ARF62916.1 transcriptional regulator [Streptomyces violaceoruber]NEC45781.1 helix-turn-helix transcriptional regulator [Streptomyces sp. SID8016]QRV28835.1 helix-turn-helix transcriptional regulator [Streptomyces californicus]QRV42249.1 helix-turn-helix transcriptional regulator [Streptomyces californicus]
MTTEPPPDRALARRQQIGRHLRELREDRGLTQIQLGERAGMDHKTVHRIEYAMSDPSLSMLLRLAAALGVPLADLVA